MPVRALHNLSVNSLNWSFSSTRKTIERMVEKGQVATRPAKRATIYEARISRATTLAHIGRDFMRRVLEAEGPVSIALFANSTILSDEDLDEIEGLL